MTILFAGSEMSDFTVVNPNTSISETTSNVRSGYCRRCVRANRELSTNYFETPAWASAAQLSLGYWFSINVAQAFGTTLPFLQFHAGANRKLGLEFTSGRALQVVKWTTSGTKTVLQTGTAWTQPGAATALGRLTMTVDYQASGRVQVWVDGLNTIQGGNPLLLDYSGDLTTDGDTGLTKVRLGGMHNSSSIDTDYTEIVVATTDARSMALISLPPSGAGDVNDWSGTYADIDETPASSADTIASTTASQVFTCAITAPTIPTNHKVSCVKVVADALREVSGPQNLSLGVRQSSTNGFGSAVALDTGYAPAASYLETNPVTSAAWGTSWTTTQLALRSET